MIRKIARYDEASRLRRRGFTYAEIAHIVGVSKSTVSNWFSREAWSHTVSDDNKKRAGKENSKRISLLNKARSTQLKKQYLSAEQSAITEFKHYKHSPAFVAGMITYSLVGDLKQGGNIRITSTRKDAHRIFIHFAQEYLGVSRESIRFWLILYANHAPHSVSRKWSRAIHVPIAQFHRYQVIERQNSTNTLHDGVGNTIIGSALLKRKLLKWVELASKEY